MSTTIETISEGGGCFRLGDRLVEPRLNRLTRDGESIQLEIKAMDVLLCLVRRAGEVVTRQEIVDAVWATEFISDNTLTHAIAELRNALGDDARTPSFIETIHRRGYRLITAVEPAGPEEPNHRHGRQVSGFQDPRRRRAQPLPRSRRVHRVGRRVLLRPRGRGRGALAQAHHPTAAGGHRAVGGGQELAAARRSDPRGARRVGGPDLPARRGAVLGAGAGLAPDFSDDPEALAALFELATNDTGFAVISRWRRRHDQALLIVDQLEELFTQNPPEVQARFAELLGRLAREADIHVLLAMRDDFLYRCHDRTRRWQAGV